MANHRSYPFPIELRTWIQGQSLPLLTAQVTQAPFSQLDWPLSQPLRPLDQTWVRSYNVNLIGKDKFPPGQITAELTAAQKPARQVDLSWTAFYNRNLIGKDILPTGQQRTDTPAQLAYLDRASFTASYNKNLIGKDSLPVGKIQTALTIPEALRASNLASWLGSYNLDLVGQDYITAGKQYTATPAQLPGPDRASFVASYNRNLIGKDAFPARVTEWPLPRQPADGRNWIQAVNLALATAPQFPPMRLRDWPLPFAAQQPIQTLTASFNRNLVGQDQLPIRQRDWQLPLQPADARTWIQSVNLALTQQPRPFAQWQWPLSGAAQQPVQTFVASFNRNLVGQDQLPVRQRDWQLPLQPADARTWIQSVNLALTQQLRPVGQWFWVLPATAAQPDRSFVASYNVNLIGKDRLPAGKIGTDLPAAMQVPPRPLDLTWASFYNRNLIGKDQFPIRQRDWPLPVPPADGRTWIWSISLALTVQPRPLTQWAWTLPIVAGQPDRSFVASYNVNLIGKDFFPAGRIITELSARQVPPRAIDLSWAWRHRIPAVPRASHSSRSPQGASMRHNDQDFTRHGSSPDHRPNNGAAHSRRGKGPSSRRPR